MYKFYILSFFAVVLNLSIAKADTRDSIGVENYHGKKLIIHKTVAKDTYYSIGRRYHVPPKEIMTFNDNKYLQIGVIIKIPTNTPFSEDAASAQPATNTDRPSEGTLIEHAVQKKENLNMLAERYGTTVDEIKRINNLRTINLQIGQILKIPASSEDAEMEQPAPVTQPMVVTVKPESVPSTPPLEEFIEHTVASNETIYSIATRYKLTIDQLKAKNNLKDNSLNVGQKLLVKGQYPPKPAYVPPLTSAADDADDTVDSTLKKPLLRLPASKYGLNEIDEKGTATWITDPDLDSGKMLVLHRTAPIGGIIKITNPMTNRVTFAKVVGKFTENETTKDVIIVITKAVADALGALDKRFFCNITYGGQENEQK